MITRECLNDKKSIRLDQLSLQVEMFRLFLLLSLMAITFSYNISLPKSSSSEDISDEWYPENSSEEFRDYSNFTAVPIVPRSGRHDIIEKKDELSIEVIIIASVTGCCAFIAVVVGAVGYAAKQRQRARAVQVSLFRQVIRLLQLLILSRSLST